MIDGHGGSSCSAHVKQNIAKYVANHLNRTETNVAFLDIFENAEIPHSSSVSTFNNPAEELIKEQLKNSFVDLDNNISEKALNAVKQFRTGHTITSSQKQHIHQALTGACVNALLLYGRNIFVANAGGCRSVLGRREDDKWVSVPLSTDHTWRNQNEVTRIMKEHPGEEHSVINNARLLSRLMPLRSFGDAMFKWRGNELRDIDQPVLPDYYTPPYLTAEPEVTHHQLANHDKFAVVATDGIWDCLTSETVVNIIGDMLSKEVDDNILIATVLIKEALGKDDSTVYNLLKLRPPESREYRDDITIIVVIFS